MKKTLLIFLSLFIMSALFAQTSYHQQAEQGVSSFRGQDPSTVVFHKTSGQSAGKSTLNESFEGMNFPPLGWTLIDADGDTYNWMSYTAGSAHTGMGSAASASWVGGNALTPNNHLITPALVPATGDTLSFWYAAQDPDWPSDKFQVLVSTSGKSSSDFTDTLYIKTITDTTWTNQKLSLSSYVGDTIYVSFNHWDCTDWFVMKIDDVEGPMYILEPDMAVTDITSPVSACTLGQEDVTIEISNLGGDTVSSFQVGFKVDNGSYTMESYSGNPIAPGATESYTFSAKADLSATGTHQVYAKVVYTGDNNATNDEISQSVENIIPKTPVYTMGFETGEALDGWKVIDVAEDGATWYTIENGVNPNNGTGYVYCPSPSSDDWLITTCLDLTSGVDYEVSVYTKTKTGGNESFEIKIGQDNTPSGLSTKLKDVSVAVDAYYQEKVSFTVATSGVYYIGFHANSAASSQTLYLDDIMIDDLISGINPAQNDGLVKMFPNPANRVLNLQSDELINHVRVLNVVGQTVLNQAINDTQSSLDISTLKTGVYFVQIENKHGVVVKKLHIKR